jgi:hypothetical protein
VPGSGSAVSDKAHVEGLGGRASVRGDFYESAPEAIGTRREETIDDADDLLKSCSLRSGSGLAPRTTLTQRSK